MSLRARAWSFNRFIPSSPFSSKNGPPSVPVNQQTLGVFDWPDIPDKYSITLKFDVLSFNMLAPVYKRLSAFDISTGFRKREAQNMELWKGRANRTIKFFHEEVLPHGDIIALQELWLNPQYLGMFEHELRSRGYELRVLKRTGNKMDAVALAINGRLFQIMDTQNISLCPLSDRVALILWVKHRETEKSIVVASTHLSFPHSILDKVDQLHQMQTLITAMDTFAKINSIQHASRIIMGDFNVESRSPLCDHLRQCGYCSSFEVKPPENGEILDLSSLPISSSSSSFSCEPTPYTRDYDDSFLRPMNLDSLQNISSGAASNPFKDIKFVSHLNHRNEELGVDHIFIRPETFPSSSSSSSQSIDLEKQPYIIKENTNSNECLNPIDSSSSTSTTTAAEHLAVKSRIQQSDRIFITDCFVIPQQSKAVKWDKEFIVSDHRPVKATVIFARPLESEISPLLHGSEEEKASKLSNESEIASLNNR
jgi:endonuclease/exonuclease/phosphatase family metal-dependent hydrolase